MGEQEPGMTSGPTGQERERLRLAHHRLRKASQECEALAATEPMRGRWDPEAVPPAVAEAAVAELHEAYRAVLRLQGELLGWEPPERLEI